MIPTIINDATEVYYIPRKDGKRGLVYEYHYDDGSTYYLEQIIDGNRLINAQMIKTPAGVIPELSGLREAINNKRSINAAPGAVAGNAASPQMYVQHVWRDASKVNVAQSGMGVNRKSTTDESPGIYTAFLQRHAADAQGRSSVPAGENGTYRMLYTEEMLKRQKGNSNHIYTDFVKKAEAEKARKIADKLGVEKTYPTGNIYTDYILKHSVLGDYKDGKLLSESTDGLNVDLENGANSDTINMDRKKPTHRKITESGRKIIDQATYHKVTAPAIRKGADIRIADDELMHYLKTRNATAVTIGDIIIFRPDATTSEVLEEIHHFYQNRASLNVHYDGEQRQVMNELDTLEYLLSVSDKYKIPVEEIEETKLLQEFYMNEKERLKREGKWNG